MARGRFINYDVEGVYLVRETEALHQNGITATADAVAREMATKMKMPYPESRVRRVAKATRQSNSATVPVLWLKGEYQTPRTHPDALRTYQETVLAPTAVGIAEASGQVLRIAQASYPEQAPAIRYSIEATARQLNYINSLASHVGVVPPQVHTKADANRAIRGLKARLGWA